MIYPTKKLGEISNISSGNMAPQQDDFFKDGVYPFFRTSDVGSVHRSDHLIKVRDYLNKQGIQGLRLFPKGTLLFPKSGASTFLNHRVIMGIDGYVSSHLATITPKGGLHSQYLYYFSLMIDAKEITPSTAYPSLRTSDIKNIEIPFPPLSEQKKIVKKIKELFAKIDEAQELRREAKESSANLFSAELQKIFQRGKKDGWINRQLQELCDNYKQDIVDGPFGSNLKRSDYLSSGIPILKIQNIKEYKIQVKKMDFVSKNKANTLSRHSYIDGDIIMTKLGDPLGISAIVTGIDNGIIVADLIRIRAQKMNTQYLCYFLNSSNTKEYINSKQKGTTRKRIRLSIVRELPVLFPPLSSDQKKIVERLDSLHSKIRELQKLQDQIEEDLVALKQSILHKAFKGELA